MKEKLTKNLNKHREYINALVHAYNDIVRFVELKESTNLTTQEKEAYKDHLIHFRGRFQESSRRLNIESELSNKN